MALSVIDGQGYRLNVGIVLRNRDGYLLLARRNSKYTWQFPQGGMTEGETVEQTMYRELYEELGITPKKVMLVAKSAHWYSYRLPRQYVRSNQHPVCIGQKQKWFLLDFLGKNADIDLDREGTPEFNEWNWFHPLSPIHTTTIFFKRHVYEAVLNEFAPFVLGVVSRFNTQHSDEKI